MEVSYIHIAKARGFTTPWIKMFPVYVQILFQFFCFPKHLFPPSFLYSFFPLKIPNDYSMKPFSYASQKIFSSAISHFPSLCYDTLETNNILLYEG